MIEDILTRRSCRSYTSQKVNSEDLEKIVKCGLLAPSGMNTQGIVFRVIENEEILRELAQRAGREFFYQAPSLIVVAGESENRYVIHDGSCAMAQMYLAAHSLGLGSVWINQLKDFVDDEKFDDLFERMNLKGKVIVGALAVGYEKEKPAQRNVNYDRVEYIK